MTPHEFIRKWKNNDLTERASAQEHFIDLCRLFGHPTPDRGRPHGEDYAFEKGVTKTGGGDGFADVWKRGFFAWEYKKRKRNLDRRSTSYALRLGAGKPAAAGRLRHRALQDRDGLDQHGSEDLHAVARRPARRRQTRVSCTQSSSIRRSFGRSRPARRSPRKRPKASPPSSSACSTATPTAKRSRISSTSSSSASSPKT